MKKITTCFLSALVLAGCASPAPSATSEPKETPATGNYSDEMKIPYKTDLSKEDGADSVERTADHKGSPYFNQLDFYNMESNDTLSIISNFKTYQQTSEWSCGVCSALMVLDHYDKLDDYTEEDLAKFRSNGLTPEATTLKQEIEIFEKVGGFQLESTYDYMDDEDALYEATSLKAIEDHIKKGEPVIVAWNDWGGHWQVIIGYDNMGTDTTQDDVIIVADSYDTTDHNQDGYGVYPAERFYYNWTMYDFFEKQGIEERNNLFLVAKPE